MLGVEGMAPSVVTEASALSWWDSRRARYNMALLISMCAAAAISLCLIVAFPDPNRCAELSGFALLVQSVAGILALGAANLCYYLGPVLEALIPNVYIGTYRAIAYRMGWWFSVALPMPIPVLIAWQTIHGLPAHAGCE